MVKRALRKRSFLLICPYILQFSHRLKKMEAGKCFGALVLLMSATFMYISHTSIMLNQRRNVTRVYSIGQEIRHNCNLVQKQKVRMKPKNCTYCREYRIYKPIVSTEQTYNIVLMITSSHRKDAAERRRAIRSTWADDNHYTLFKVQHFFVLGKCKKCNSSAIFEEAKKYRDIVMFDFLDTYNNLTIKTLATLDFAYKHFNAHYFIKVDDDFYIHVNRIMSVVENYNHKEGFVIGLCPPTLIGIQKKDKTSLELYPDGFFPPYCKGGTYVVTRMGVAALLTDAATIPLAKHEDVAIGVLAGIANVKLVNIPGWRSTKFKKSCPDSYTLHNVTAVLIKETWKLCGNVVSVPKQLA